MGEKVETSEILKFLEARAKSRCPWCGGDKWEYVQDDGDVALDAQLPMKASDGDDGRLKIRPASSRPNIYVHLRCANCGCALAFDYFYVIDKIRNAKEGS